MNLRTDNKLELYIRKKCTLLINWIKKQIKKEWTLEKSKKHLSLSETVILIMSVLIGLPVLCWIQGIVPDLNWWWNLDRVIVLVLVLFFITKLLSILKWSTLTLFVFGVVWLSIGSLTGTYGVKNAYKDYIDEINSLLINAQMAQAFSITGNPLINKNEILEAVNYKNPEVRNFALQATVKHFKVERRYEKYRIAIQSFAVFKEINEKWNYVNDPDGKDYFAKAEETVQHLSGDCDDYAIFMAACIKAVGGESRIIFTKGHMYPELLIGNTSDEFMIRYIIKKRLFKEESKDHNINFHTDDFGQIWLNMDYSAKYPGGPYMSKEIYNLLLIN